MNMDFFHFLYSADIPSILDKLYKDGVQTVLVEGGAQLLQSFMNSGLWDECYVEKGSTIINGSVKAPVLSTDAHLVSVEHCFGQQVSKYLNKK